jgi:hypothetical protein
MTVTTGYGVNSILVRPEKPLVHSWSSLNAYEQCPWRFYLTKIAKSIKEGQSPAMTEGNNRHKALEIAVRDGMPLPERYQQDLPMVEALRAKEGTKLVEWQFGITRDWTETTFFAQNVWIRGKIDFGVIGAKTALLLDYKDGKRKEESNQLALFSIPAFIRWPYLERVDTSYIWLKDRSIDPASFTPEQVPELKERFAIWIARVDDSVKRGFWPKSPSGLCREHCPVGHGNCEYCGT